MLPASPGGLWFQVGLNAQSNTVIDTGYGPDPMCEPRDHDASFQVIFTCTVTIVLYGIPNCDTVKRARAWLAARGVDTIFHDFKKQGVPEQPLDRWLSEVGWEKLVNRQGSTRRKLDVATQTSVKNAASARPVLLNQPSVIRRPVVEWDGRAVSVGFTESLFQAHLNGKR